MQRHKNAQKVGFGLAIDDLPNSFSSKNDVIEWESQFWQKEVEKDVFLAPIDTTFALYRPFVKGRPKNIYMGHLRTGYPYIMHHLPWYINSDSLSEEDEYYVKNISTTSTHWSQKVKLQ
jgi:hypothetical protein